MTFERQHRLPEEPQTEKDKRVLSKLKTEFGALRERSEQTRQQGQSSDTDDAGAHRSFASSVTDCAAK